MQFEVSFFCFTGPKNATLRLAFGDMELVYSGVYHLVDPDKFEYIDSIFENVLD